MNARTKIRVKNKIDNVRAKLESLRAKHAHWNPADAKTIASWQKHIDGARIQMEFASHPLVERVMRHHTQAVKDIDFILLSDKELDSGRRVMLMEKKEMYAAMLRIFVLDEKVIEFLEKQANSNLQQDVQSPTKNYSHSAVSGLPYER